MTLQAHLILHSEQTSLQNCKVLGGCRSDHFSVRGEEYILTTMLCQAINDGKKSPVQQEGLRSRNSRIRKARPAAA